MRTHTVEISDTNGQSFRIVVSQGYVFVNDGNWRSLEKGFIRYGSGAIHAFGDPAHSHLQLLDVNRKWGIQFNDWEGLFSINDQGSGTVMQPWVIGFEAGSISWILID